MKPVEDELREVKVKILKMGSLVEEAIGRAIRSLVERNNRLAEEVIEGDRVINTYDVEIDEECIRVLALRQPVGGDLRFITTAMKITTDLERIGDFAENISHLALELNTEPQLKPYIDIPLMAKIVQGMVVDVLEAFTKPDTAIAYDVIRRDEQMDNLAVQIFNELLFFMIKDPSTVSRAVKISYVAKHLERMADHATNIAEMVIYMVEGKFIRHLHPPKE
jgi:phosphate transport system protein